MGSTIKKGTTVTVDFMNADGSLSGEASISTEFIEIFGTDRCNVLARGGITLPAQSDLGSEDWLTVVAIANSEENLGNLKQYLADEDYFMGGPETSGSSHGVAIAEYKENGDIAIRPGCLTLATGLSVITPPATPQDKASLVVEVNRIFVFPPGTVMNEDHPFGRPWTDLVPTR
ncbi:hypothetical protein [uncultured Paludibaculum sp.]|uniref:hypothetical protein n=1 Tax=uncultured Paludibaculum sp. TaxID=1765020 RepID=UPI002AAB662F|nr:hypothetical protein [uncultured Paludibaculum sp.]